MSSIGENIRAEREKANIKQHQLAQSIGVGQAAVSRFECNSRRPSVVQLKRISETLGCSFSALINEEQEGSADSCIRTKNPSNDEGNIEKNLIQTLLSKNPDMGVKLRSLAKRSEELTREDWLFLADHIIHAFGQIEMLLKYRD
ncbi:MAG: helix-turn-helix transcriptional regulator [Synergistaceae bacterium]|nr:helix-turn-helix transcriptional regulator [Synergistaceae bacterium]